MLNRSIISVLLLLLSNLADAGSGKSIEETSSWRIAIFFIFFIALSFFVELLFHNLEHYFHHGHQEGLVETVHKIKDELMLMGFITLMLIAVEDNIVRMCVPDTWGGGENGLGIYCCGQQPLDGGEAVKNQLEKCLGYANDTVSTAQCNSKAVKEWKATGGYVAKPASDLIDICRAPGQTEVKLMTSQHDFECPSGESGFMDVTALHNLHTLIFLIAIFHILYSTGILVLSKWRIKQWTKWEKYGDDEGETPEKLKVPPNPTNPCNKCLYRFGKQFVDNVTPLSYVSARKYYIKQNKLNDDFNFEHQVEEVHSKDFKELVGISWWMWLVIIIQTLLDGFLPSSLAAAKILNTYISVVCAILVGVKLMYLFEDIFHAIIDKHREHEKDGASYKLFHTGKVTQLDLDVLQNCSDETDLSEIETTFWCQKESVLLNMIRLIMFQNSIVMAQTLFYFWQIVDSQGGHKGFVTSCYFESRKYSGILIVQWIVTILMFFQNALVTVPLYTLCALLNHHEKHGNSLHERYNTVKKHKGAEKSTRVMLKKVVRKHTEMRIEEINNLNDYDLAEMTDNNFLWAAEIAVIKAQMISMKRKMAKLEEENPHLKKIISEDGNAKKNVHGHADHSHKKSIGKLGKKHSSLQKLKRTVKTPIFKMCVSLGVTFVIILMLAIAPYWWPNYGQYVAHWTYEDWGGPKFWFELHREKEFKYCKTGFKQSPINIITYDKDFAVHVDNTTTIGSVVNFDANNHQKFVVSSQGDNPAFSCETKKTCGYLKWKGEKYYLKYIYVHTPSEHTFNGAALPMEIQMDFCNDDKKCYDVAVIYKVEKMDYPSDGIKSLWKAFPKYKPKVDKKRRNLGASSDCGDHTHRRRMGGGGDFYEGTLCVNMSTLIDTSSGFWAYNGSATVPPCKEKTTWFVQSKKMPTTSEVHDALYNTIKGYPGNARPPQKLYDRRVDGYSKYYSQH